MAQEEKQVVEEPTEYTVSQKAEEEGWKLHFDAIKHLTTLSTGSILILVTFLEKLFTNPNWKLLVGIAFGLFVISIIASIYSMLFIASAVRDITRVGGFGRERGMTIITIMAVFSYVGFIAGIISLIVFALKNLYV